MRQTFGEHFKELRINLGVTLRAFCQEHGYDPGNMSRMERGMLQPPQSEEKLTEYASALGLQQGSDEWFTFFDLAAAQSGRLPKELLSDEEVMDKLPVLFRTLRGQKVDKKHLNALIDKIRGA